MLDWEGKFDEEWESTSCELAEEYLIVKILGRLSENLWKSFVRLRTSRHRFQWYGFALNDVDGQGHAKPG